VVRAACDREMSVAGITAAARAKVMIIVSSTDNLVLMQSLGAAAVGILRTSSRSVWISWGDDCEGALADEWLERFSVSGCDGCPL
jgi:hypothetical protein